MREVDYYFYKFIIVLILINKGMTKTFLGSQGIRQRDLTSLYLFIFSMEILSHWIQVCVNIKWWRIVKIKRAEITISYLFFIDDFLLIEKAMEETANCMLNVLQQFGLLFGQKVNEVKSRIVLFKNVDQDIRRKICRLTAFQGSKDIGLYLGFSINKQSNMKAEMKDMMQNKMKRKLSGQKAKMLSMAGRNILVKSSIEGILEYYMQAAWILGSILNKQEKLIHDCFSRLLEKSK